MNFIISLIIFLLAFNLNAEMPELNDQFERYSENKKYYLTSIPYEKYGDMGKTYLIENESKKSIFTIDKYFENSQVYVSNSGKCIIEIKHSLLKNKNNSKLITLTYTDNTTISFSSNELLSNKYISTLENQIIWINHFYLQNDILYLLSIENKIISIDVNSGKIIKIKKISDKKKNIFKKNKVQHIFINTEYDNIPNTTDSQNITSILEKKLNKKNAENIKDSKLYISISLLIDKFGKAEIRDIWVGEIPLENFIENNELTTELLNLIQTIKFKTENIPEYAEIWIFSQKIYLK